MQDPYEVKSLDAAKIVFSRGTGGVLNARIDGVDYAGVVLHRTFPLSKPAEYISLHSQSGEEIGILPRLSDLDENSRNTAEMELKLRYLVPVVNRIDKIKQEPGLWVWDLTTDRGPMRLLMRNLHDHIQVLGPGRILLSDLDGQRCEIENTHRLDVHSRKELSRIQ